MLTRNDLLSPSRQDKNLAQRRAGGRVYHGAGQRTRGRRILYGERQQQECDHRKYRIAFEEASGRTSEQGAASLPAPPPGDGGCRCLR